MQDRPVRVVGTCALHVCATPWPVVLVLLSLQAQQVLLLLLLLLLLLPLQILLLSLQAEEHAQLCAPSFKWLSTDTPDLRSFAPIPKSCAAVR